MKKTLFKILLTISGIFCVSLTGCKNDLQSLYVQQGPQGESGVSILSIKKTSSEGLQDTYTIFYSNGSTDTFIVTNGQSGVDGQPGIQGNPGLDGKTPTIFINNDGNWVVNGVDSGIKAQGENGQNGRDGSSLLTGYGVPNSNVGNNGDSYVDLQTWFFYVKENDIWEQKGTLKGEPGQDGKDGFEVVSIEKTGTNGLVDTYTLVYSNGQSTSFIISNDVISSLISNNNFDFMNMFNINRADKTSNNVSFNWSNVNSRCVVTTYEPASASTFIEFVTSNMPESMVLGGTYFVRFVTTDDKVDLRIGFRDENNNTIKTQIFKKDGYLYVPNNASKIFCRFFVSSGQSVNAEISEYSIFKYKPEFLNPIYTKKCPKIIVFKDDDTANDVAIQRYRDACLHNGIVGSYATVADRINRNSIDVNKLVQFEQEGFTIMCHCNEHASYWRSGNYDIQSQREDMAKVVNTLRENGLINYMYWQTPFGSYSDDILHLCRSYGFKGLGTTMYGNSVPEAFNHIEDLSRYNLVSFSMKHDDSTGYQTLAKAKELIDMFASSNGGVLIFTTHFADWSEISWDTNLDSNGYPVGFERFNELAQYSVNSGCQIMNFADAVGTLEPYFID